MRRGRELSRSGRRSMQICPGERPKGRRDSLYWKARSMAASARRKKHGKDEKVGELAHSKTSFD